MRSCREKTEAALPTYQMERCKIRRQETDRILPFAALCLGRKWN